MSLFVGYNGKCFFNNNQGCFYVPKLSVHVYLKIHLREQCHLMKRTKILTLREDTHVLAEEMVIHPVIGIQMMNAERLDNVKP